VEKALRVAIALGAAAALAYGALSVVRSEQASQRRSLLEREARRAWADTAHCLLGEPADGRAARAEQLRRIALGASCDPVELSRPVEQRWPRRCAARLDALRESWQTLAPPSETALLFAGVGPDLEQGRAPGAQQLGALWQAALDRFGIPAAIDRRDALGPPRPSSHPELSSLEPLFELPARVLRIKQPGALHVAGEDELLVVAERSGQPGAVEARRFPLERALERHTHLVLDPGAPALLAVHAGSERTALVDLEAAPLLEMSGRIWSVFAARDGSLLAHSASELVRRDARGGRLRMTLPPTAGASWMRLAGSHLLVRERQGALVAHAIGARGLGPRRELGTTSIESPTLELCKTESHVFVILHERNVRTPMQLVMLDTEHGQLFALPALRQRLSCTGDRAVAVGLERSSGNERLLRIVQTTCGPGGCSVARGAVHPELAIEPELGDELLADAIQIGSRIAVAWRSDGVFVKVATLQSLVTTQAQPIADDTEPVRRFRLDPIGESAVLLLDSTRGSLGFIVTPLGVLPLAVD
jgi:hypothetical protein